MKWCDYKPIFTATDLLDSGACPEGVAKAVNKYNVISANTADWVTNSHVALAASANGSVQRSWYGSGYGDGDGDGYGAGYGDGYGTGSGNGYGDGDGYGTGYGDGQ